MDHDFISQKTVARPVTFEGVGIHSGAKICMTVHPAAVDHGIVFVRNDMTTPTTMPAHYTNVVDTKFCSRIGNTDGITIGTIEHLLSALQGMGIDNAIIELDGAEVPVMDGSARTFVENLSEVGLEIQNKSRRFIRVLKTIRFEHEHSYAALHPQTNNKAALKVTCHFDARRRMPNAVAEASTFEAFSFELDWSHDAADYRDGVAPARTFGFLEDVQKLNELGLAKGGSLDNAVVFDGEKVLNPEGLRFEDECARHKVLDALGDLYLAGAPIIGHFEGFCSGHHANHQLLVTMFNDPTSWQWVESMSAAA